MKSASASRVFPCLFNCWRWVSRMACGTFLDSSVQTVMSSWLAVELAGKMPMTPRAW